MFANTTRERVRLVFGVCTGVNEGSPAGGSGGVSRIGGAKQMNEGGLDRAGDAIYCVDGALQRNDIAVHIIAMQYTRLAIHYRLPVRCR